VTSISLPEQLSTCPTAHHVVDRWAQILEAASFNRSTYTERHATLNLEAGYFRLAGSLVAWRNMDSMIAEGVRLVGAHTDSPGLHLKPKQGRKSADVDLLDVEVYGGPLLSSWADRDLRIAGHVLLRDGRTVLYDTVKAVARISLLAIHLDREVNDRGLVLDRHLHLSPIWGQGATEFIDWLARTVGVPREEIVSWSGELADTQMAEYIGRKSEFLASGRLDNQVSCWAAMTALLRSNSPAPSMVVLFDHEEVGSTSSTGANGPLLERVLEYLCLVSGGSRLDFLAMLSRSHAISADNSHALHPNHQDRHDLTHAPLLNGGVAIKTNVSQRYATSTESLAPVLSAFHSIGASPQWFSSKNSIPCGSTIGPLTATRLGIPTVDIGVPQLSMHSIREVCGARDPERLQELLAAYWER